MNVSNRAGKVQALGQAMQALAEKYGVSVEMIDSILLEAFEDPEVILNLSWKELDAVVQEGLVGYKK